MKCAFVSAVQVQVVIMWPFSFWSSNIANYRGNSGLMHTRSLRQIMPRILSSWKPY